jgi:tetratricopeptide (TPR) repeat protein
MVSSVCMAQYSSHQLYQAYLVGDMQVWGRYLEQGQWERMTKEEQHRYLNYEYGYLAYSIAKDANGAKTMLQQFEEHLQEARKTIDESEYYAYMSGLYSYKLSLEKIRILKYAPAIFENIKLAMKKGQNNPFVLAMQGNVEFYNPMGSKEKALDYFEQAEQLYLQTQRYEKWNLRTVQMHIIQCLDKMGRKQEAINQCKQYLEEEPKCVIFNKLLQSISNN